MSIKNNTISLQEILESINTLPDAGGVELPELTNEGTASDLLAGKQLIDQEGNIVEGTIATKTSSNLTASGATVTVPSGYYASQATKNVTTATQATPSITIDANGLITATATQTAGYVAAGTKSGTKQLAFQPAKTITPSTASQIAVSGGYYTGGDITVAGDSNLVAGNIKSGVSIFGVSGTLVEGSGSGEAAEWSENEDAIVMRTLSSYTNNRISSIGAFAFHGYDSLATVNFPACRTIGYSAFQACYRLATINFPVCMNIGSGAFNQCSNLTTISFPMATRIGKDAFVYCYSLTTISFPMATSIGDNAFYQCTSLTTADFPMATRIGNNAFGYCSSLITVSIPACKTIKMNAFSRCSNLTTISFPAVTVIETSAFYYCRNLKSLYLTGSFLCQLSNSNAFASTPYTGHSISFSGTPYIYVPQSLLASYKAATNWTYFSSYFRAVEDGDVDGDSGGGDISGIITFYIDEEQYQAEEGMTWVEWVNSDYNTCEAYVNYDRVFVLYDGLDFCCLYDDSFNMTIDSSELIIEDYHYISG